ncbi:MAG: glycosyltransferase [Candidatus Paceibacterota bacterium]|jgi:hypothetical protein
MKIAIFLYETSQLASLDALLAKYGEEGEVPTIVSLDAEIDFALKKRDVPFVSGKTLQNRISPNAFMRHGKLAHEICESETLSFLEYKNIPLLKPLRFSISIYLIFLLYYIEVIAKFVDSAGEIDCLVVQEPTTTVSKTSGSLAEYELFTVVEAARQVAQSRHIVCKSIRQTTFSVRAHNILQQHIFTYKRILFGNALSILNMIISLRPRRKIRIIASDYWRNISPVLRKLPEAELILLDRSEALKMGFKTIWRHKAQFMHIEHFLSRQARREALQYSHLCLEKWQSVRTQTWEGVDFMFCGVSLAPLCERIMTRLMEHALPRVLCDIEGTYAMYEQLVPHTVLLRASISGQVHFAILPLVAKRMGIPSLESQHGIQYFGPGSTTIHHAAEYIATYGNLVSEELIALGYEPRRLFSVGSPRFDSYAIAKGETRHETSDLVFLSVAPAIGAGEGFGTFSTEEYFAALGHAMRNIPNAHLAISARSGPYRRAFAQEAEARGLVGVSYKNVSGTPLPKLFAQADVVICSYSTVVYEAMLHRKPVVVVAFAPIEKLMCDFHFSKFVQAGALAVAHSPEELAGIFQRLAKSAEAREHMSATAEAFMGKQFSFDGHASERIADRIRLWSRDTTHYATS